MPCAVALQIGASSGMENGMLVITVLAVVTGFAVLLIAFFIWRAIDALLVIFSAFPAMTFDTVDRETPSSASIALVLNAFS